MSKCLFLKYHGLPVSILWKSLNHEKGKIYDDCTKRGITELRDFLLYLNEIGLYHSVKLNLSSVRGKETYFVDCEVYDTLIR